MGAGEVEGGRWNCAKRSDQEHVRCTYYTKCANSVLRSQTTYRITIASPPPLPHLGVASWSLRYAVVSTSYPPSAPVVLNSIARTARLEHAGDHPWRSNTTEDPIKWCVAR